MNKTMSVFLEVDKLVKVTSSSRPSKIGFADPAYANVLGIPTLQTGVFGGIIVGIVADIAIINTSTLNYHHT